jgi:hypothetical protein
MQQTTIRLTKLEFSKGLPSRCASIPSITDASQRRPL